MTKIKTMIREAYRAAICCLELQAAGWKTNNKGEWFDFTGDHRAHCFCEALHIQKRRSDYARQQKEKKWQKELLLN